MGSEGLRLVNAIVGFCTPMGEWPHPLADLGYVACGVEREITVDLGHQPRQVVVDLICASSDLNHALCAETKTRTVPIEQARKYRAMNSSDLVNFANLPETLAMASLTHDVLYVAGQDNSEDVVQALSDAKINFPVLACGREQFVLRSGTISQSALHSALASGIPIPENYDAWPLAFVPFLADSPDAEIARPVGQALLSFLVQGHDFTASEIGVITVGDCWNWFGAKEQRRLKKRFSELVDSARKLELHGYIDRPDSLQRWTSIQGRITQHYDAAKVADQVELFVNRIRGDIHVQSVLSEQFS